MLKGLDKEIQVHPHHIGQRVLIYSVTVWSRVGVIVTPGINNNSIIMLLITGDNALLNTFLVKMKSFLFYYFRNIISTFCIS